MKCLICGSTRIINKIWSDHIINDCQECSFAWINFNKHDLATEGISNSSITTDDFYDQAKELDSLRTSLFIKKIAQNRIKKYSELLERPIKSILEVGCGTGATSDGFVLNNIEWEGIEVNQEIYNFSLSKNRNVNYGDFINFQFNKKYDVIFASQVLEHIDHPHAFIEKAASLLNHNGLIHVDVPNNESMISFLRKFMGGISDYGALRPPEHMRAYSKKSLRKLFEIHGFLPLNINSYANDDEVFGQLTINSASKNIIFFIQSLLDMQSLLVGIARKNR